MICLLIRLVVVVDNMIELWIFDIVFTKNPNMSYDRIEYLKDLEKQYNERGGNQNRFVYYDLCHRHEDLEEFHQYYVEQGFEGIMCRNLAGSYLPKNRSNDLLKYKAFCRIYYIRSETWGGELKNNCIQHVMLVYLMYGRADRLKNVNKCF